MQHLPAGQLDEEGCFIYQVLCPLAVRDAPSVSRDHELPIVFQVGDLVSVNLIVHTTAHCAGAGPYLRLADYSGWLFEFNDNIQCMRRVPVETGLWRFHVDNYPVGIAPRSQPIDRQEFREETDKLVVYEPSQKLYCDKRILHPVTKVVYFRVQGTSSWVFDRRDKCIMLLDASRIRTGLFAYRALRALSISRQPDTAEKYKTHRFVEENDIVVADYIRYAHDENNGMFMRMTDGSGWLYTSQGEGAVLEAVEIENGEWELRVLQSLTLLRQPIDNCERERRSFVKIGQSRADFDATPFTEVRSTQKYYPDDVIICDKRIKANAGDIHYYRKKDTQNWLFDSRDFSFYVEVVSEKRTNSICAPTETVWTPDLVRGMALTIDSLKEVDCDTNTKVLTFTSSDKAKMVVFYAAATVGTAIDDTDGSSTYVFRQKCTTQDLLEIMRNPRTHAERGLRAKDYKYCDGEKSAMKNVSFVDTPIGKGILVEEEEELRLDLLDCERQLNRVRTRTLGVLRSIQKIDFQREEQLKDIGYQATLRREELLRAEEMLQECTKKVEMQELARIQHEQEQQQQQQHQVANEEKKDDLSIHLTPSKSVDVDSCSDQSDNDDDDDDDDDDVKPEFSCGECKLKFISEKECNLHCRDVHGLNCFYCGRIFKTMSMLNKHRDTLGHW